MYLPFIWATSSPHASLTGCICLPFGLHPHWQPQSHRMLLLSHAMSSNLTENIHSHRVLLSSLQDSTVTESWVSVTQGAGHTLTEINASVLSHTGSFLQGSTFTESVSILLAYIVYRNRSLCIYNFVAANEG